MPDRLRFTILGCGSSPGVPRINGDWGACDPDEPRNRRTRCSLLVERISGQGVTRIVVDTSPDFREQMLSTGAENLDAVLYTHPHADHIHGIDDLRQYAIIQRQRIPVYSDAETHQELLEKFGYIFESRNGSMYPAICDWHQITAGRETVIEGEGGAIRVLPIYQLHGPIHSLGFRFGYTGDPMNPETLSGGLAYCPDVSGIPEQSSGMLGKLDWWVLDALQHREHISHFSLSQALKWIERMKPAAAVLTHMHIPLDYRAVHRDTPKHVEPAYDGMRLEMDVPA